MSQTRLNDLFTNALPASLRVQRARPFGRAIAFQGLLILAEGIRSPVGSLCRLGSSDSEHWAKIIGFTAGKAQLMPLGSTPPISEGMRVYPQNSQESGVSQALWLPAGDQLLGRSLTPLGEPLDQGPPIRGGERLTLDQKSINPLERARISQPLDVGVRAINGMLTLGQGQRVGIFAGSGVGKSTLLGMMAQYTQAERVVVGLIGERGREVKEFIEESLGPVGRRKAVVIAAPADASPLLKIQGAEYASALAEGFRDQGNSCLLIMDSLTRYAMAAREVGLAIGEPPATKGYPPSVFARINSLVERAGNGVEGSGGSITALYTVLSEGDDLQDPVADNARAILDGHIVLSRALADQGHYPPIDVGASVSRAFSAISSPHQAKLARKFRQLLSAYSRNRDLINIGAYVRGSDPDVDQAIVLRPQLDTFLRQDTHDPCDLASTLALMSAIFPEI